MKNIKNLGIITKEGFEVKNLQRFPSMEWGDEGGLQADLYLNGIKILRLYQEGNGGPAITYLTEEGSIHLGEIRSKGLEFLKRVDKNYGPNTEYNWLKNKTVKTFNDDDWEAVINNIEEYFDLVRNAAHSFRAGYKAVVCLQNDLQTRFLQYKVSDITEAEVREYMKKTGLDKEYNEIKILLPVPELSIL